MRVHTLEGRILRQGLCNVLGSVEGGGDRVPERGEGTPAEPKPIIRPFQITILAELLRSPLRKINHRDTRNKPVKMPSAILMLFRNQKIPKLGIIPLTHIPEPLHQNRDQASQVPAVPDQPLIESEGAEEIPIVAKGIFQDSATGPGEGVRELGIIILTLTVSRMSDHSRSVEPLCDLEEVLPIRSHFVKRSPVHKITL